MTPTTTTPTTRELAYVMCGAGGNCAWNPLDEIFDPATETVCPIRASHFAAITVASFYANYNGKVYNSAGELPTLFMELLVREGERHRSELLTAYNDMLGEILENEHIFMSEGDRKRLLCALSPKTEPTVQQARLLMDFLLTASILTEKEKEDMQRRHMEGIECLTFQSIIATLETFPPGLVKNRLQAKHLLWFLKQIAWEEPESNKAHERLVLSCLNPALTTALIIPTVDIKGIVWSLLFNQFNSFV